MQVSIETTSGLQRRLTVGIPAAAVDQEVNKRLAEAAKTVRINGFRKGKVPLKVVKQRFGAGVRQEVVGDVINRSFYEAVQKEAIRPAGRPDIEATQLDEGKDIEFVATFDVYPEVVLQGLDMIVVKRFQAEITDADIDKMVDTLRESQSSWVDSKAALKSGFKATISYVGLKDGVAFDGGSAENQDLVIGSNSMIPGFEDGLVGAKPGEEKTLELTFPADYHSEGLRGAEVVFTVTVNKVQKRKLPELDDDFFAKFGVTEGGESKFREDVKANMEREKQRAIRSKTKDQVLNGLLEQNKIEVPQSLVTSEIDALRRQTIQQYGGQMQNLDLKSLLPDDMFRSEAERRTTLGLLVSEIVASEKMQADADKVRELIEDAAATYEDPVEVVNYYYSNEQLLATVEAAALEDQVVEFLLGQVKVTEQKVTYEEAIKPLAAE